MRRREFIALSVAGAATWPSILSAQSSTIPILGFLSSRSADESASLLAAFRSGLAEVGFSEGRNLSIAFRWAEGRYDRLPALATDLVALKVALIVAAGGPLPALSAKEATSSIPVVFTAITRPDRIGLVASLNRPGANVTGISTFSAEIGAKRLGVLHELLPAARNIAILVNPNSSYEDSETEQILQSAQPLELQVGVLKAATDAEVRAAFVGARQQRASALIVATDPYFDSRRSMIVELASRYAIPTIYSFREYVAAGGLISYGITISDNYRKAGVYAGRILKGERPSELPVMQPTKLELVINTTTARTLSITVPPTLLATADEVIE